MFTKVRPGLMMADFDEITCESANELYKLFPAIGNMLQTVVNTKEAVSDWASWVKIILFYEEPLALLLQHVDGKNFPSL
jgi:hypothetical protein